MSQEAALPVLIRALYVEIIDIFGLLKFSLCTYLESSCADNDHWERNEWDLEFLQVDDLYWTQRVLD